MSTNNSSNKTKYEYEDSLGGWNVIYPIKVYDAGVDKSKETKEQGTKSALTLLVIGCVFAFFFINSVLSSTFGISSFWSFLIVFSIVGTIGVYVFRFFIFKEEDKLIEFENEDNANLGKFFELLTGNEGKLNLSTVSVPFYKYVDGSFAVCIKLRHGSSDKIKRYNTQYVMQDIANILGRYKLSFKQFIKEENFSESIEYQTYINKINRIENEIFRSHIREMSSYMFDLSSKISLVDCTYIIIKARNAYQKYQLGLAVQEIKTVLDKTSTVYRGYDFLSFEQYIELCREYFGVEVVDLSTIRAITPTKDVLSNYRKLVNVVEVELTDGTYIRYKKHLDEVFNNPTIKDL